MVLRRTYHISSRPHSEDCTSPDPYSRNQLHDRQIAIINTLGAIVSTRHLVMKFPLKDGQIAIIHADHARGEAMLCQRLEKRNSERSRGRAPVVTTDPSAMLELDPQRENERNPF